jgi:hypothetical protein
VLAFDLDVIAEPQRLREAIRIPATALPRTRWLAKPITNPITADDASSPPATARTPGITSSAESTPTKTTVATIARRRTR